MRGDYSRASYVCHPQQSHSRCESRPEMSSSESQKTFRAPSIRALCEWVGNHEPQPEPLIRSAAQKRFPSRAKRKKNTCHPERAKRVEGPALALRCLERARLQSCRKCDKISARALAPEGTSALYQGTTSIVPPRHPPAFRNQPARRSRAQTLPYPSFREQRLAKAWSTLPNSSLR